MGYRGYNAAISLSAVRTHSTAEYTHSFSAFVYNHSSPVHEETIVYGG